MAHGLLGTGSSVRPLGVGGEQGRDMNTRRLPRRRFLQLLAVAVPVVTIGSSIRFGVFDFLLPGHNLDLLSATDSTFSPYVGQRFRIGSDSMSDLQLNEVLRRGPSSFSLFFTGSGDRALGQGTYNFEHSGLGHFPLFIVPGRPQRGEQIYEAVFNHQVAA
jgi:hypothetical protein